MQDMYVASIQRETKYGNYACISSKLGEEDFYRSLESPDSYIWLEVRLLC